MDFKKVPISPRAPAGFRLSTFDEATRHFLKLTALQIIDDLDILRLLDGVFCNCKEISIDDNSWPVMNMLVFAKSPTIISNDSSLLRRELYSGVNLRVERKVIALRLSCMLKDIEVVHWLLLQLEPKPQFKEYLKQIVENEGRAYFSNFLKILKILLRNVQIRETKVIKSLDYAVKDDEVVPDNALAIAEILLDECREARSLNVAAVVDSQIQRLANMTVEANIAEPKRIGILAKLLSECGDRLQNNHGIIESNFSKLLREATRRGYDQLTYALLRLKDTKYELEKDDLLLHYAAKRGFGDEIVNLLGENCRKLIYSRNNEGKTPLHVAAMWDNGKMVKKMKEIFLPCEGALKVGDFYGQTPLHLAASNGDEKTVQVFLDCGSDPFERDMRGRTALHHAVTNKKSKDTPKRIVEEDTPKRIVEALLDHLKCNKKKALLLWISATDIGTADEAEDIDPQIKEFLVEQKSETYKDVNVLKEAAESKDLRLTWEFLNRGGNISSIVENKKAFDFTTKAIEMFSQHATDSRTLSDTLGRDMLAECISAHFLNPYIKSPITVCISGGSGSGKSSLLYQIEACLLITRNTMEDIRFAFRRPGFPLLMAVSKRLRTASQLAFPNLWDGEMFNGSINKELSSTGKEMLRKIENGVYKLLEKGNSRDFKDNIMPLSAKKRLQMSLMYLLTSYLPKHESVYKYLACMDFNQLMEEEENESVYESQGQLLGAVPRILAVNFNAGNYRKRTEAWAGLAIEITKEIETSMTWAQLLSTRWRNMWTRNSQVVYSRLIFPGVLLAFVGALIGWAAWKLIDRAGPELEDLKYGSVTATVIAIVWYALQNVISVFKPISEQMSGYFSSHDYSQELGYQQKVIEDIKFLKGENGKKPYIIFSFIAGEMCKNWWGLWKENVKNTSIPRYGSAPEGKLRIIAFVDDLDQCEESVILPMLWAINLVFRVCEINVILTMDKATIQTAYRKSSLVQERDFVDNFISKLVQLPVNIPDPTDEEWVDFLDQELLRRKQDNEDHLSEERPSNAQCGVDEANGLETEEAGGPKDIESGGRPIQWEGWCITLWIRLLIPRLKGIASRFLNAILFIVCVVICNIRDETPRNLRFSKDDEQLRQSYKRDLSKLARNLRETFLPSYTDEEVITFHRLKRYATGIQKLPREWKCWMNYHKFERNIVSKMPKVKKIANPVGWEVEFVVWTFVCSQWKHEMNALIEEWYNYADEARHDPIRVKLKSSLKEVVANYIKQGMRKEQRGHQVNSTVEDQLGEPTGKQVFIGSNSSSAGSVEKELERWKILQNCLESVHDVSLEGLRCFQHYRYHCDARNLVSKHHAKELSSSYGDTK